MKENEVILLKVLKTHRISVPEDISGDGIMELKEGDIVALPAWIAMILLKRNSIEGAQKYVEEI